jgi:hypothetical protein
VTTTSELVFVFAWQSNTTTPLRFSSDEGSHKRWVFVDVPSGGALLEILVENLGRVSYGAELLDGKGIVGRVQVMRQDEQSVRRIVMRLSQLGRHQTVFGWQHVPICLNADELASDASGILE